MQPKVWSCGSGYAFAAITLAALLIGIPAASGIAGETELRSPPLQIGVRHAPVNPRRNPNGSLKRGSKNQMITGNWSGYEVANYQTGQTYTSASATWQVPTVAYGYTTDTSGWEFSSQWIGIGGFCEAVNPTDTGCTLVDQTLIQLGTETQVCVQGGTSTCNSGDSGVYYAWYEMLPAVSQVIQFVHPGDIMTASLQCQAPCTPGAMQTWTLSMSDTTVGWSWSQDFQYASNLASAEWILEAPYGGGLLPLDDYVLQTFEPVSANGIDPGLSLATNGLIMEDPWGQTSNPSAPVGGDWFSTCYGVGTALTSCTAASLTPSPTATLAASPSSIAAGQSSTLSWSSTNATACTGGNFGASGTSGDVAVAPAATTTYSLTCSGSGGSATSSATVTVGRVCHGKKKCGG